MIPTPTQAKAMDEMRSTTVPGLNERIPRQADTNSPAEIRNK
jgi:hypothetical protein